MKRITVLFMAIGILLLTGCGITDPDSDKTGTGSSETTGMMGSGTEAPSDPAGEETVPGETNAGNSDGSPQGYDIGEPGRKLYTWLEYTVTLPDDWIGRCVMEEHETGFSIYQKASYEKDDTLGYICSFFRTQEPVEYDHGKTLVAYTEDGMLYYLSQPTDVACYMEDDNITGEYIRMCQQVPQLKSSLQIAASGVHGNADEYLLPTSSILPLDTETLAGMSDNTLWIARHGIPAGISGEYPEPDREGQFAASGRCRKRI